MKVKQIDAVDIFGSGGYIDLSSMRYIPQRWYWEMFPDSAPDMTDEKYRQIHNCKERYLTTPRFNSTGITCAIALKLGVSRETLYQLGAKDDDDFWKLIKDDKNFDGGTDDCSLTDEEWEFKKAVKRHLWSIRKYNTFCFENGKMVVEIATQWFNEHGIEVEK